MVHYAYRQYGVSSANKLDPLQSAVCQLAVSMYLISHMIMTLFSSCPRANDLSSRIATYPIFQSNMPKELMHKVHAQEINLKLYEMINFVIDGTLVDYISHTHMLIN